MTGALIILVVTMAVGVILWAWEKARGGKPLHHHQAPQPPEGGEQVSKVNTPPLGGRGAFGQGTFDEGGYCCGLHAICEKTGQINEPPVYYDDEELDRFAGRGEEDYSDEEIEEFRDVLLTLMPQDAPGWTVSLERRRINLPVELKPELELLLSE